MTVLDTGYWKFDVFNVYDDTSLSSYALEQTPLKFIPTTLKGQDYSNQNIIWDFGDESPNVSSLSATHSYFYPGEYRVTMTVMLSDGNTQLDSFFRTVKIFDFVPNTFAFKTLSSSDVLNLSAGIFSDKLTLERFNSLQSFSTTPYTFFLNCSGSDSLYYDKTKLSVEPYAFLLPTHRFVKREELGVVYSDTVINKLDTTSTNLYGKLDKTSLVVPASSTDVNAFFVGTSGYGEFYFVDDFVRTNPYYILATLDTSKFPDNYTKYYQLPLSDLPIKNTFTTYYTISSNVFKHADYFSITSNGLDGEGFYLDTFDIGKSKFYNQVISFVAKLKTNSLYNCKNQFNKLNPGVVDFATNAVKIYLVDSITGKNLGDILPYTTFDTSTFKDYSYGWVKGNIIIPEDNNLDTNFTSNNFLSVRLSATSLIQDNEGGTYFVSGSSSDFNLYPSTGINRVAKINENFDMSGYMKSTALQPSIYNKPVIFDTFFSTIFGNISSGVDAIGKRIYEKTANFVSNNVNIDTCNIDSLISYADEYNIDLEQFASSDLLINYPAEISRLVNLFSIKKSLLFGKRNQSNFNFINNYSNNLIGSLDESIGYVEDNKKYGYNKGEKLDILSYVINKSENYIVAEELYSSNYSLLRVNLLSSIVSADIYPLSSFSKNWGWGLVLPDDFYTDSLSTYKLSSYYNFYNYYPTVDGTYNNNIINWEDTYNTTVNIPFDSLSSTYLPSYLSSYNNTPLVEWDTEDGIIEQNLAYQLSLGSEILSS